MSDNHSRFLNLERGRAQAPAAGPAQGAGARFDALERPGTPAPVAATGAVAERFQDAPAPGQAPLELAESRPDDQPFVRCARCEADNSFYAETCFNCGASFNTPEQRAFNERIWQQRREEAAREEQEVAALREQKAKADMEAAQARRQAIAMMAAGVATQTRNRLEREEREDGLRLGIGTTGGSSTEISTATFFKLIGVGVLLMLLVLPQTRRFTLFAVAIAVGLYFKWLRHKWRDDRRDD
jgi:hypothetical protein